MPENEEHKPNIFEKLSDIQTKLKCEKTQYNDFGNYYYRNLEDILKNVKGLLAEKKLILIMNDDAVMIGDRHYIKAKATIIDLETGERFENTALAREADAIKGMNAGQVTGATSSFARKYCLNGLFCIDDSKELESVEQAPSNKQKVQSSRQQNQEQPLKVSAEQIAKLEKLAHQKGVAISSILQSYGLNDINAISMKDYAEAMNKLCKRQNA